MMAVEIRKRYSMTAVQEIVLMTAQLKNRATNKSDEISVKFNGKPQYFVYRALTF
jgi:hypothetical protein